MNSMVFTFCFVTLLFSASMSSGSGAVPGYYAAGYYGGYPFGYGAYNNYLNGGLVPGAVSPLTAAGAVAAYNYGNLGYGYNYGYGYPYASGYGFPYYKK
ncbi:sulfur globule protein CV2-like [Uloborus diversus]|uniref:sulfur globule protein CV2-like n=1 Tax=Uloborus diversus TaxID=327109 RepID=UPI00240A7100|nr:sulfur globule protein CV2-like [Uloborus diversus]